MPVPPIPERFGDFLLLQRLAAGGMGDVWIAVRLGDRSGRTYVVKRPLLGEKPSGRAAQAIAREGEVLSAVRGAGVVALEAAGDIAGLPYIAIEHVRGAALDVLLGSAGALPAGAVRAIGKDLAEALAALHAAGWVHGDVAPSNILLDDAGELRLIDFGLATRVGAKHIEIAGKPGYIAPEAVRPVEAAAAEDVYGWGVVVAECALGRRLFNEESLAEAGARGEAPSEAAALEEIVPGIGASLRRDPSARPETGAIAERLKTLDLDRAALAELVARAMEGPGAPGQTSATPPPASPIALSSASESSALLTPTVPMAVEAISELPRLTSSSATPSPAFPSPISPSSPPPLSGVATNGSVGGKAPSLAPSLAPGPAGVATNGSVGGKAPSLPTAGPGPGLGPDKWKRIAISLLVLIALAAAGIAGRFSARRRDGAVSIAGSLPRRTQIEIDGRPAPHAADGPTPLEPGKHTIAITPSKGERREYPINVRPGEHIVLVPISKLTGNASDQEQRAP